MKSSTQDFITEIMTGIGIFLIVLAGIAAFVALVYFTVTVETTEQAMYNKCLDSCERLFQEQKLIECIQTCGQLGNQTISRGGR